MRNSIILTGSSGFLGKHIVNQFSKNYNLIIEKLKVKKEFKNKKKFNFFPDRHCKVKQIKLLSKKLKKKKKYLRSAIINNAAFNPKLELIMIQF